MRVNQLTLSLGGERLPILILLLTLTMTACGGAYSATNTGAGGGGGTGVAPVPVLCRFRSVGRARFGSQCLEAFSGKPRRATRFKM